MEIKNHYKIIVTFKKKIGLPKDIEIKLKEKKQFQFYDYFNIM